MNISTEKQVVKFIIEVDYDELSALKKAAQCYLSRQSYPGMQADMNFLSIFLKEAYAVQLSNIQGE